jgi:hypothetical protein
VAEEETCGMWVEHSLSTMFLHISVPGLVAGGTIKELLDGADRELARVVSGRRGRFSQVESPGPMASLDLTSDSTRSVKSRRS